MGGGEFCEGNRALICPICKKRKAKRYCPAKAENICTLCCGTEREVTIDCPSDCPYLVESRKHKAERQKIDWSRVPFADVEIPSSFVASNESLIMALGYAISVFARDHAVMADADIIASLQRLAEAYQTLTKGIYYEKPPEFALQHGLYDALKTAVDDFENADRRRTAVSTVHDSQIRDALVFLTQLGATRANGRPKGRAFLDFLRGQFKSDELRHPSRDILVVP